MSSPATKSSVRAAARVTAVEGDGRTYAVKLDTGSGEAETSTICSNLHTGDLVAYDAAKDHICTLEDLHADQKEFPHCIPDGIFVLHEEGSRTAMTSSHYRRG